MAEQQAFERDEERCPERTAPFGAPCGRPLHRAQVEADVHPVCLMHSMDTGKAVGELRECFFEMIDSILTDAGEATANFFGFIFPDLDLGGKTYACAFNFSSAIFWEEAQFQHATFTKEVDFSGAEFAKATFQGSKFNQVDFRGARFTRNTDLTWVTFHGIANFSGARFEGSADFRLSHFDVGSFRKTQFASANFAGAIFESGIFGGATFSRTAELGEVNFTEQADFEEVEFMEVADFQKSTFGKGANFSRCSYQGAANFHETVFEGTVFWEASNFLGAAAYRQTQFRSSQMDRPSAIFALARFSKPDEVVFDRVDLSRVLFHNCDVSQLWFTSSVTWGRSGVREAVLFEETAGAEVVDIWGLWTGNAWEKDRRLNEGHRDFNAIAQIYQQLKKNFDSRLDYWTADKFHFGEMEMKRLDTPVEGPILSLRQWWHLHFSLVAFYRLGSSYGNSYRKPLWLLVGLLALFSVLFSDHWLGTHCRSWTDFEDLGRDVPQCVGGRHFQTTEGRIRNSSTCARVHYCSGHCDISAKPRVHTCISTRKDLGRVGDTSSLDLSRFIFSGD